MKVVYNHGKYFLYIYPYTLIIILYYIQAFLW